MNTQILEKLIRKIDRAARVIDGHAFVKTGETPSHRIIKRRQIATRKAADILRDDLADLMRCDGVGDGR